MFIRQLGCKAYIDFPGAIHTRFSHALGTMSLASRMVDMLQKKMAGNIAIVQNLKSNKDNIMAAGFLHDIGHGPFSHVIDFVLKRVKGQDHEELGEEIVRSAVPNEIESWGISKNTVVQLIRKAKGGYRFLSQIINGPIDADKLDYLLRDAHHVGYKYSFDLDHFLRSYTVIVEEQNIAKCALGLEPSREARGTAELFVMIWKGMYDLVYHSEKSRIAEKMLEKALLLSKDDEAIKGAFDMTQYLELNDEKLLSRLGKVTHPDVKPLVAIEDTKRLYKLSFEKELQEPDFHMTTEFLGALTKDADELSDSLSCKLNDSLSLEPYTLICDIVTSKAPEEIPLDEKDEDGVSIQLSDRSKVVAAITPTSVLKIYVKPDRTKAFKMDALQHKLKELAEGPFDFVTAQ